MVSPHGKTTSMSRKNRPTSTSSTMMAFSYAGPGRTRHRGPYIYAISFASTPARAPWTINRCVFAHCGWQVVKVTMLASPCGVTTPDRSGVTMCRPGTPV